MVRERFGAELDAEAALRLAALQVHVAALGARRGRRSALKFVE